METTEPDAIERLILDLRDDRRDVRSRAAYELGKQSDPRAIVPLIAALADNDKFVRSWAAGALGKSGPATVEPLLAVLDGKDQSVAYYAALALGEVGDLHAVPTLVKALREGDYDIRPSAAGVLVSLGDEITLPARVLADSTLNAATREDILRSLRDVSYSDEEHKVCYCVPDIGELCRECLQSEDSHVRTGAQEVLQALEAPRTHERPLSTDDIQDEVQPVTPPEGETPAATTIREMNPKRSLWSRLTGR